MRLNPPTRIRLKRLFPGHIHQVVAMLDIIDGALPHTEATGWDFESLGFEDVRATAHRVGKDQKELRIEIGFIHAESQRSYRLSTSLSKHHAFGTYEFLYSNSAAEKIKSALEALSLGYLVSDRESGMGDFLSSNNVADAIVAAYLEKLTDIRGVNFTQIIRYLKELAQQSYESKPISYGLLVTDRSGPQTRGSAFPSDVLENKRFKAITDGYRTALHIGRDGLIRGLVSLGATRHRRTGEHFRPLWLDPLAETAAARRGLGVALSRNGAILISWKGSLALQYRISKWTLFNHSENIDILAEVLKRVRGNAQKGLAALASRLYRCALDVSFRRTGGLFIVLSGQRPENLSKLVPKGEELLGGKRKRGDRAIGATLENRAITALDREVICDLAALDGAIVCARNGQILAYGSVLKAPRKPGLHKIEGSRSRAAHSGSFFGLSIKISSDGGIEAKQNGDVVLEI